MFSYKTMNNSTNITLAEDDLTSYPAYKAGVLIWKIVPPILLTLGTVGNFLSILVLTRRSIRSSTTALYLIGLALSDLLVLYSGLFRQWLIFLFDTDIRKTNPFLCKVNIWMVYTSLDFSAWILMAVTLERVISAWLPHNARTLCTKKSAFAFMASIAVFLLALNSHMVYGMGFVETYDTETNTETVERCVEVDGRYTEFFNHTWPWIDLCAFCVIPFSVIVVGNAMILFKVIQSQRKARGQIVPSVHNGASQRTGPSHHGKQSSMTAMLFTLNIVFLFSTSPVSIYNIGYAHWLSGATTKQEAELDLWWAIVNMFQYTNNSLNFLLYCLSGTKFRQEVKRMFCKPRLFGRRTEIPLSNYTRTRFDKSKSPQPSPTPTTKSASNYNVSGLQPTPGSNQEEAKLIINTNGTTNTNGTPNTNGITHTNNTNPSVHNNNLLHPSSALKASTSDVSVDKPIPTVSENVNATLELNDDNSEQKMPSIDV